MGSIAIPKIGLRTVFVENTDHAALKKGPGHYKGTVLPGMTGTVGLAGHRTTYGAPFRRVNELSRPARAIVVNMPYGKFTYKVIGLAHHDAERRVVAGLPRRPAPPRADRLPPALQRGQADRRHARGWRSSTPA